MLSHEVDDLGRYFFSRDGQVAFVLPILIIHDDEHAAGPKVFNGLRNRSERHGLSNQDSNGKAVRRSVYLEITRWTSIRRWSLSCSSRSEPKSLRLKRKARWRPSGSSFR